MPGLPEGHFAINPGAMLASADAVEIKVTGKGGHGGMSPHKAVDTVLIASQIVSALQSIVARNVDPLKSAVVTITMFNAGTAFNIIPETAMLTGTVRTLDPAVRDLSSAGSARSPTTSPAPMAARPKRSTSACIR